MVSAESPPQGESNSISTRVGNIIFVYNNIPSEVNQPPSVCFTL